MLKGEQFYLSSEKVFVNVDEEFQISGVAMDRLESLKEKIETFAAFAHCEMDAVMINVTQMTMHFRGGRLVLSVKTEEYPEKTVIKEKLCMKDFCLGPVAL